MKELIPKLLRTLDCRIYSYRKVAFGIIPGSVSGSIYVDGSRIYALSVAPRLAFDEYMAKRQGSVTDFWRRHLIPYNTELEDPSDDYLAAIRSIKEPYDRSSGLDPQMAKRVREAWVFSPGYLHYRSLIPSAPEVTFPVPLPDISVDESVSILGSADIAKECFTPVNLPCGASADPEVTKAVTEVPAIPGDELSNESREAADTVDSRANVIEGDVATGSPTIGPENQSESVSSLSLNDVGADTVHSNFAVSGSPSVGYAMSPHEQFSLFNNECEMYDDNFAENDNGDWSRSFSPPSNDTVENHRSEETLAETINSIENSVCPATHQSPSCHGTDNFSDFSLKSVVSDVGDYGSNNAKTNGSIPRGVVDVGSCLSQFPTLALPPLISLPCVDVDKCDKGSYKPFHESQHCFTANIRMANGPSFNDCRGDVHEREVRKGDGKKLGTKGLIKKYWGGRGKASLPADGHSESFDLTHDFPPESVLGVQPPHGNPEWSVYHQGTTGVGFFPSSQAVAALSVSTYSPPMTTVVSGWVIQTLQDR